MPGLRVAFASFSNNIDFRIKQRVFI